MKRLKFFVFVLLALLGVPSVANAEIALLAYDDFVGITFWLASMVCLAATIFFFIERGSVPAGWRVSITVAGLITGIAFMHYMYMRSIYVQTGDAPTAYRYIEWLITMPLLMVEFYFVLAAVRKVSVGIFWRLLFGSLVMVIGAYLGQSNFINDILGLVISIAGWIYILYEVFSGEAGRAAAKSGNKTFVSAYGAMRMIVTVGWAIYPLGYVFGYLTSGVGDSSLNVIYNVADLLNKVAFGLIIWTAAIQQSGRTR